MKIFIVGMKSLEIPPSTRGQAIKSAFLSVAVSRMQTVVCRSGIDCWLIGKKKLGVGGIGNLGMREASTWEVLLGQCLFRRKMAEKRRSYPVCPTRQCCKKGS